MNIISYPPSKLWKCPSCDKQHSPRGYHDWIRCKCGMWFDVTGSALWEKKGGDKIAISAMETSHINSCLAMILVRPEIRPGYAKLLMERPL